MPNGKEVALLDIAAMSMSMAQAQVMQQASVSVMKKAMDNTEAQMNGIIEMMAPNQHALDVRA